MRFVVLKCVKKTLVLFLLASVGLGLYGCKCGKDRKFDTLLLGNKYFLDACLTNIGITYTASYNNVLPFDVPVEADGIDTEVRLITITNNNPGDKGCDLTLASAAMLNSNDLNFDGFQDSSGNPLSSPIQFGSGASVVLSIRAGPSTSTGLQINTLQIRFDLARTRESGGSFNLDTSAWFVDNTIACSLSSSLSPSTYTRLVPLDATVIEKLDTSFSFVPLDCNNIQYQGRVNKENDPPGFLAIVADSAPAPLVSTPVNFKYADFTHSPTFGPPGSMLDAYYIFSVDLAGALRHFSKKLSGDFSVSSGLDPCVAAGVFSRNPASISMAGNYGDAPSTTNGLVSYDGANPAANQCLNRPYEIRERQVSASGVPLLTINLPITPSRTGKLGTSLLNFNFDAIAKWPVSGAGTQSENRVIELVLTDSGAVAVQVPVSVILGQIDPCVSAFSIAPGMLQLTALLGGAAQSGILNVTFNPTVTCSSTNFTASFIETGVGGNLVSSGQASGSLSSQTTIPYSATLTPNNLGNTSHVWTLVLSTGGQIAFDIDASVSQDPCISTLSITPSTLNLSAVFGGPQSTGSVDVLFSPTSTCPSINFNASRIESGTPNILSSSGPTTGIASTVSTFKWSAVLSTSAIGSATHNYSLSLSTGGRVTFDIIGNVTTDPCLSAFTLSAQSITLTEAIGGPVQSGNVVLTFTPTGSCSATSFTTSKTQTGTQGILTSGGPASGSPSSPTAYTYNATLTPTTVGSAKDFWAITLQSGGALTFSIIGNVTQSPCAGALSVNVSPDPIVASINGVDRFGDVIISNNSTNPACTAVDGAISLQSTTLGGGTFIEVLPYSFNGLLTGQSETALSLARVSPGSVVETGFLLVTLNYGVSGSGALTEVLTFPVNADIQALWSDCLTNVLDIAAVPDNILVAAPGSPNVYRSIDFSLAPRCQTGAIVSWLRQPALGLGGTQLVLNSGSVSLDPGQTLSANNIVEFIPGSIPLALNLNTLFTLTPRAPGVPSINLVGPPFFGTVTPPPVSIASCNISSPQSGASVSGNVNIEFDAAVPSGVMNYQIDAISSSIAPTIATPTGGSVNPVVGAINGTHTFNWNTIADSIGVSDRQDVVVRITVTDGGPGQFASTCLVQLHVNNSSTASCRTAPAACGDVDSVGGITVTDALLVAQIAQGAPIPSDLRCSDTDNIVSRCETADVDRDGVVTGVTPVAPSPSNDSGIIASYVVGSVSQLTCNNEQMIYNNSATLPIGCVNTLMTTDYCLAVPQSVTAAQLQSTGVRVYATDAQFPGPGQGVARIYVRLIRVDGISTTYSLLQLQGLPTPYLVATPADVIIKSQGLLTDESLLIVLTESGICGIISVTP